MGVVSSGTEGAGERPVLRSISPDASAEETAAIVSAVALAEHRRRLALAASAAAAAAASEPGGPGGPGDDDPQRVDAWVTAARLTARRSGMTRGPWRLAGRLSRRARA